MKSVLLKGPGQVVLEQRPVPEISADEVLIEIKYCGICGSDVHSFRECSPFVAGTYLGHEYSGVLVKVGKNVKGWQAGDRVVASPLYYCGECHACQRGRISLCKDSTQYAIGGPGVGLDCAGAFAKYVKLDLRVRRLYHLPDEVSFEEGSLVEPLATSLHAVRISSFRPRERVMVLGAGVIGLGAIAHLKNAGAGLIIATYGRNKKRADMALQFGADYTFSPYEIPDLPKEIRALTGGEGVDVVFDCSGYASASQTATSFIRRGGQVVVVAMPTEDISISPADFAFNEWDLQGSFCYYADEFPMVTEFLKRGVSPVKKLLTSKIRLSDIVEKGFKVIGSPGYDEIKILVAPDE